MKIKEILKIVRENTDSIILLKEGIFWRAYERSAYRFVKHLKLLRIIKDMHQINIEKFANVNLKIENISKQLAGWQKSCKE